MAKGRIAESQGLGGGSGKEVACENKKQVKEKNDLN